MAVLQGGCYYSHCIDERRHKRSFVYDHTADTIASVVWLWRPCGYTVSFTDSSTILGAQEREDLAL